MRFVWKQVVRAQEPVAAAGSQRGSNPGDGLIRCRDVLHDVDRKGEGKAGFALELLRLAADDGRLGAIFGSHGEHDGPQFLEGAEAGAYWLDGGDREALPCQLAREQEDATPDLED